MASQSDRQLNRQPDRQPKTQTDKQTDSPTPKQTNRPTAQNPNRQTAQQDQAVEEKQTKMASEGFYPMVFEFEKNFDQDWARQWVQANWVPLCSSAGFDLTLILSLV